MKFIVSILIPLLAGAIAGFFTDTGENSWYANANKPSFNPPGYLFGPVWTVLYVLMGIALYLVWRDSVKNPLKKKAVVLFFVQLALNFCWSFIFFSAAEPGWAFAEIILMWVMILATIIIFCKISKAAAWLMVPYIAWVSFASVLNFTIWQMN